MGRDPEQCVIDGLPMATWVEVFLACHTMNMNGVQRVEWPDGGTLSDQPALLVSIFNAIEVALLKELSDGKRH